MAHMSCGRSPVANGSNVRGLQICSLSHNMTRVAPSVVNEIGKPTVFFALAAVGVIPQCETSQKKPQMATEE